MSQASSQVQDPSWVSLPFEKYSYNNSRIGTRKYTWSHIGPRNDLDFVIRNVRVVDENGNYINRVVMKISAGADILETQDLGELATCYKQFEASSGGENPIQVVVRPPIWLAMVYPKTNATVQRTQFKFFNEADFRKALTALTELGLPTRESLPTRTSTSSVPPPSSSPCPSMFSTASASTTFSAASSVSRPGSSFQVKAGAIDGALSRPSSTSSFKVPRLPESSSSNSQRSASALHYSIPHATRQLSVSLRPSTFGAVSALSNNSPMQDSTKQVSLYLSQMDKEHQTLRFSQSVLPDQSFSNIIDDPNLSLFVAPIRSQRSEDLEREVVSRPVNTSPFFSASDERINLDQQLSSTSEVLDRLRQSLDTPNSTTYNLDHSASNPTDYRSIQNLWIPPRRELPFPKPQEGTKNRSSSLAELPPLPKPTPLARSESIIKPPTIPSGAISTPAVKPAKKRIAQRKAPASKVAEEETPVEDAATELAGKDKEIVFARNPTTEGEASPLAVKSATVAARPVSAASGLQSKATAATKKRPAPARPPSAAKRSKMVDQSTQTQTVSGRDHTVAISTTLSNEVPELTRDAPSPSPPPENYLEKLDNFITKHKARPAPKELWEAPGYSQADQEEREAMLNDFICQNLENPDFLQLCQDTEFAWRRIGLGM